MRVIDADKLMLSLADWKLQEAPIHTYEKPKEFTADDMQKMIWRTIRDCESAVEEQPTVEAIPIEWILNYRKNNRNQIAYYTEDALDYMLEAWCEENNIDMWDMINSWEKENDLL